MKESTRHPFGGEGAEEYGAVWKALHRCAENEGHDGPHGVYTHLEGQPRTSLVVFLVDALHELGFQITKREA